MKLIRHLFFKLIISVILLYLFNYFSINYQFVLPMNIYSIIFIILFGGFGLVGLVIFYIYFL
ncbi:MAG: pro-sigmaK processing inhibitor BofA family protein [Bacilli bacterium]|nr:pro-sigmaK processing inhibitor BofA family protein [Bacilli bacterium]